MSKVYPATSQSPSPYPVVSRVVPQRPPQFSGLIDVGLVEFKKLLLEGPQALYLPPVPSFVGAMFSNEGAVTCTPSCSILLTNSNLVGTGNAVLGPFFGTTTASSDWSIQGYNQAISSLYVGMATVIAVASVAGSEINGPPVQWAPLTAFGPDRTIQIDQVDGLEYLWSAVLPGVSGAVPPASGGPGTDWDHTASPLLDGTVTWTVTVIDLTTKVGTAHVLLNVFTLP